MKTSEILPIQYGYQALVLDSPSRDLLLKQIKPEFTDIIAHHITVQFPATSQDPLPPQPKQIKVIGVASDHKGVQAAIVELDGTSQRPDGKIYHITISIDKSQGAKPVHSNDVIAKYGYEKLSSDINIRAKMQFIAVKREKHGRLHS